MERDVAKFADGSVLVRLGDTHVLCTAKSVDGVPGWRRGSGSGWLTAEYSMLPAATSDRTPREAVRGKQSGRTQEIQRLIGRSLRAAVDFSALGERSILIDCDVIVADGGTRTAAITGGYVALALAVRALEEARVVGAKVLRRQVAAVSAGIVGGEPRLDLCYLEDSAADTDLNCVGADDGRFIEIQGTAEGAPFSREELDRLLALSDIGLTKLFAAQAEALGTGARTA